MNQFKGFTQELLGKNIHGDKRLGKNIHGDKSTSVSYICLYNKCINPE